VTTPKYSNYSPIHIVISDANISSRQVINSPTCQLAECPTVADVLQQSHSKHCTTAGSLKTSPPQSNLRKACLSSADKTSSKLLGSHSPSMLLPFKTSLAKWHSARLGISAYVSVCRCTLTAAKWLLGHSYLRTGVSPCYVCFVAYLHLNFSSTPNSIFNLTIL